ncbi:MAG: ion transporter [Deltaproteobacteria bacterium]|nr:ion transporter [Deltaproteobacteria bacterium]
MREDVQKRAKALVETSVFQTFVTLVIVANAAAIGFRTASPAAPWDVVLATFDIFCLGVYVVETVLKLTAYRRAYFRDGWNLFDFTVISLSLIPTTLLPVPVQVARLLRIIRTFRDFRIISIFSETRLIAEAIVRSLPGVLWTAALLFIICYVFAVIGVTLFGETFPQYFGSLGKSLYTLFQIMTLESWSHGIARPVIAAHPWAWLYFVPFVVMASFIMLNVVVGLLVNSIGETKHGMTRDLSRKETEEYAPIAALEQEMDQLREHLEQMEKILQTLRKEEPK